MSELVHDEEIETDEKDESEEYEPEPPESFVIEYLNTGRIRDALPDMGFRFVSSRPLDDNNVEILGESYDRDGTTITISVAKGKEYKSPKDKAEEERAAEETAEQVVENA